jgi:hypothetical protein
VILTLHVYQHAHPDRDTGAEIAASYVTMLGQYRAGVLYVAPLGTTDLTLSDPLWVEVGPVETLDDADPMGHIRTAYLRAISVLQ